MRVRSYFEPMAFGCLCFSIIPARKGGCVLISDEEY
ncbi:hypothetical protein ABID23_001588 [Bartonella silvatica]|uniref:Uncharacterized protein n=1 Tax=Bartonella silvatica TaxID=357760 RepID=A0ABV2HIT1_9HYPH